MDTLTQKQVKLINLQDILDVIITIRDFRCNNCCETSRDRMIVGGVAGDIIAEVKALADNTETR